MSICIDRTLRCQLSFSKLFSHQGTQKELFHLTSSQFLIFHQFQNVALEKFFLELILLSALKQSIIWGLASRELTRFTHSPSLVQSLWLSNWKSAFVCAWTTDCFRTAGLAIKLCGAGWKVRCWIWILETGGLNYLGVVAERLTLRAWASLDKRLSFH